jgi:glucose-6-phosphate 1-dehydrogenase
MANDSQMIVIFGATGDLAKRKLVPALYRLMQRGELADDTAIVCLGRRSYSDAQFVEHLELDRFIGRPDPPLLEQLIKSIHYRSFHLATATAQELQRMLQEIRLVRGCSSNTLFYLALPTSTFSRVASLLHPLIKEEGWKRVVFEKPFGEDLESAEQLNKAIGSVLSEEQIFRVDHYLGKELVQNILFLRFANTVFSCAWNSSAIDHVQITVSESLGVEDRAGYYDRSGAIRDMVQNHLLQLLCFTAMEPPRTGQGNAVRDEAAAVMAKLRPAEPGDVVVGQYAEGGRGEVYYGGYLQEKDIPPASTTETYVALRAWVDTPRWFGVPFYLRTGKRLASRYAEIKVVFKQHQLDGLVGSDQPNMIIIRIQPDEGIGLAFNVRKPDDTDQSESVLMDFCHHCHFGPNTPEAYESIMASVLKGDPLLFTRWDWLRASWKYIDRLRSVAPPVVMYPAGSPGPEEGDDLLGADNRSWL